VKTRGLHVIIGMNIVKKIQAETHRGSQILNVASIVDDPTDQRAPTEGGHPDGLDPASDHPRIVPVHIQGYVRLDEIIQRGLIFRLGRLRAGSSRANGLTCEGKTGEVEPADVSRGEGKGDEVGFVW